MTTASTLRLFIQCLVTRVVPVIVVIAASGCSTVPKGEDRAAFQADARAAMTWFESRIPGLERQIADSEGYIVYPQVGQFGIIIAGGQFGRGTLNRPSGTQIGWAALNTGSLGLQAGVRGFKMLVVIEDRETLNSFMNNQWTGSVSSVAVAGDESAADIASFKDGVAIYQGASSGLMAGVNIGLDYMRYKPMSEKE